MLATVQRPWKDPTQSIQIEHRVLTLCAYIRILFRLYARSLRILPYPNRQAFFGHNEKGITALNATELN